MNLEETIARSIDEHAARELPHGIDLDGVRRRGRRRRTAKVGAVSVAALGVVAAVVVTGRMVGDDPGTRGVAPVSVPAMDFDQGLRGYYDFDRDEVHLGGQVFDVGAIPTIDTAASVTPYGLVFFDEAQGVWLLGEDGQPEELAPPPEDPDTFGPTVKFDAGEPRAAWLTRGDDGVRLTVHSFRGSGSASVDVPCEESCERVAMAGIDHDRVFVRDPGESRTFVLDLGDRDAGWTVLEGVTATDVRNRTVLATGRLPAPGVLGADWRFAPAEGPESLLTFDGRHQLYWSSTLQPVGAGSPLRLDVPANGTEFVNLDSDGSVLVAVSSRRGHEFFDCAVPSGECTALGTLPGESGDPGFIGNDM